MRATQFLASAMLALSVCQLSAVAQGANDSRHLCFHIFECHPCQCADSDNQRFGQRLRL